MVSEDLASRLGLGSESLRNRTARGTVVNGLFTVGVYSLGLVRGFVVAALLSVADYGLWGVVVITLSTLLWLKQVGIGDKYIQQSEAEQEAAFQKAFTVELLCTGLLLALVLLVIPLMALVYAQPRIVAPALVLALALPASALQSPLWVYYRRMDFVRQRKLQAVDPLTVFVVTVALAVGGAGYWSLVIGTTAGAWAGAVVALRAAPYRLALRRDPGTLREYVSFSWPILVAGSTGVILAQSSVLVGEQVLGLAGVGIILLAATITDYTNRVDAIVTETLYPAICAVRDRTALLEESFVKSNRLALMWGVPFGIGLTLFAPDLVQFALGTRWRAGTTLLQAFGAIAAVSHVGFNWDAFYRARGDTKPLAVSSAITILVFLTTAIPLLIAYHLDGLAVGMAITIVVSLTIRWIYLRRLFPRLRMLRHGARAIAPTIPATGIVLLARALEGPPRTAAVALGELVLYCAVAVGATWWAERSLLREVRGYLRRGEAKASATA